MEAFIANNYANYNSKKGYERMVMENYHRIVDNQRETIRYFEETSIQIWYNIESLDYSMHWHPALEIILVLEEDYTIEFPGETMVLKPYDILIIPAGELHHLLARDGGSRVIYLFDFDSISKIGGLSYIVPLLSRPVLINKDNDPQIYRKERDILEAMFAEYANNSTLWELDLYSKLLEFLTTYGRYKLLSNDEIGENASGKQKELVDRLNKAFEYIDNHFTEDITLERAALVAGFSKFHFSRIFKECSGQNFYDYLCFKRIKETEMLLMNQSLSVTEIALRCGFSSPSSFNRTFRRFRNCTPTEYRSMLNKNKMFKDLDIDE